MTFSLELLSFELPLELPFDLPLDLLTVFVFLIFLIDLLSEFIHFLEELCDILTRSMSSSYKSL